MARTFPFLAGDQERARVLGEGEDIVRGVGLLLLLFYPMVDLKPMIGLDEEEVIEQFHQIRRTWMGSPWCYSSVSQSLVE